MNAIYGMRAWKWVIERRNCGVDVKRGRLIWRDLEIYICFFAMYDSMQIYEFVGALYAL